MESSPPWCGLMKKPSRVESSSARSRPRRAGCSISTARFWHKSDLPYGIRIHINEDDDWPFHDDFGGTAQTDAEGRFTIPGLVPGQTYHVAMELTEKSWTGVSILTPRAAGRLDLGELRIDTVVNRPHVPPTPEKRAADAFFASTTASIPASLQKDRTMLEARREHTRPLLLFGKPDDAACIDLFRAFNEEGARTALSGFSHDLPQPRELRWEFELACFDTRMPGAQQLGEALGLRLHLESAPLLVTLANDGSLDSKYRLRLDGEWKLDRHFLSMFLLKQKLATRDAEKMLAEALEKAKAENKRVFLIFSASWCGPCRQLERLLDTQKAELERHYVFVKPDISRDDDAVTLRDTIPGEPERRDPLVRDPRRGRQGADHLEQSEINRAVRFDQRGFPGQSQRHGPLHQDAQADRPCPVRRNAFRLAKGRREGVARVVHRRVPEYFSHG